MYNLKITLPEFLRSSPGITYIIDKDYTILFYTENHWNEFAIQNEGSENILDKSQVLGESLFSFIDGTEPRELYSSIYDKIFDGSLDSFVVNAHCDAPNIKRDNVILMTPLKEKNQVKAIVNQSIIHAETSRPTFDYLARKEENSINELPFLKICSICAKIKISEKWITGSDYYQQGGTDNVKLSHGICPHCLEKMQNDIQNNKKSIPHMN